MWVWASHFSFLGLSFPFCEMKELAKVTLVPFSSNILCFKVTAAKNKYHVQFTESSFL